MLLGFQMKKQHSITLSMSFSKLSLNNLSCIGQFLNVQEHQRFKSCNKLAEVGMTRVSSWPDRLILTSNQWLEWRSLSDETKLRNMPAQPYVKSFELRPSADGFQRDQFLFPVIASFILKTMPRYV
jgi:hypothetical protein